MECKHARMLLEVAHPIAIELEAAETEALASHLADCPDCGPWAEAERHVDEKIGLAMRDVPVPDGMQTRLLRRLHGERDAYYRHWAVRAAGIAAALLVTCLVSYGVWFNKKPMPDLDALTLLVNDRASSAETVEQAFLERGVSMSAPPQFEYGNLSFHGMEDFQGRQVPYLVFVYSGPRSRQPALAHVYVLSKKHFDLEGLEGATPPQGSKQSLAVLKHRWNADVLFVVVYTAGSDLNWFYRSTKHDG